MNKNAPLVSVVIVTYNQKVFLEECINSVLAQNYKNIEIIVADDASKDGTKEMLLAYAEKYPGLFILKIADINQGVTKNTNAAFYACSGKYIAWTGGDDLMLPGKIQKQVEFMENNPDCIICYHNLDVFLSDTNETLYLMNNDKAPEGNIKTAIKYGCFNGACATMVKRDHTPAQGFDTRVPIASDWLFWVETLSNGGEIRYINEVLGRYRRHANNITSIVNYNTDVDHLNSCNILLAKYPYLQSTILYRYSEILRGLRYKEEKDYLHWLKSSIYAGFNIKSILIIIIYYLSLGKIRK